MQLELTTVQVGTKLGQYYVVVLTAGVTCGGGYGTFTSDPDELSSLVVTGKIGNGFGGRLPYRNVDAITNTTPKTKKLMEREEQQDCSTRTQQ